MYTQGQQTQKKISTAANNYKAVGGDQVHFYCKTCNYKLHFLQEGVQEQREKVSVN